MKLIREYGSTIGILIVGALIIAWWLNPSPHPLVGEMAPDFELPLMTGDTVKLASHIGKDVVVLDFWASWCPPCRSGLPKVNNVARHFDGKPVAVYAVNIQESMEQVSGFIKSENLDLPVLLDDKGLVAEDYGVTGIPQTVIIDKSGRMEVIHVGLSMRFESQLKSEIQALLDGDTDSRPSTP